METQVRDNYQNFIRVLNKQILYVSEGLMWSGSLEDVEENCHWGLTIMDKFMENNLTFAKIPIFFFRFC